MNSNLDDWQGFESFAEDSAMYPYQPKAYNTFQHEHRPQIKIKIAPNLAKSSLTHNKKIINFKAKNSRKFSNLHTEHAKKQNYKKEVENNKEQKPLSTQLERPIKKIIVNHAKEQNIPIYRIPNLNQQGKLVYKGMLPKTVQQYFNIIQKDQLRGSWQSVVTYQSELDELTFNSKFQSGNLQSVRKINNDYHLYITPDTNTKGHRQWFYFTVSSCKTIKTRFIIHQFKKKLSLFQSGMRPYGKKLEEGVQDWKPVGFNIKYEKEQFRIMETRQKNIGQTIQDLYLLNFDLQIQANSTHCIASCIPYTYNYLKSQLSHFYLASCQNIAIQQSILCKTLSGLDIPLITINSQLQKEVEPKKYIIINARSHPGQTSASWVTQGLIEQLYTSQKIQSIIKQAKVVIKIVPMLNPDGVYMGNYRTGVMGIDFNRLFLTGKPDFFPEIQGLKQLVRTCKAEGDVDLYLDLHGHSILPGCFVYGPDPMFCPSSQLKNFQTQLESSKYFANKHSIAGQINTKTETSRVYFQLQEGVYSLTIQNSLGLYYKNNDKFTKQQFQSKDWKQFGKELIMAILKPYQKKKNLENDEFPFERFLSLRKGQKKDSVAEMKRFKTDTTQDLKKQINLVNQIELDHIVLQSQYKKSKSIPEEIESLNDSDNQSEDLSPQKRQELFTIVKKVVEKRQVNDHSTSQNNKKQQQYRSKDKKSPDKGQTFMNFKQYRFGYQQITLADWHARKRLLSIPKVLKSQKLNQSYIIRKAVPKPFASELMYQTNQSNKKVKTESRQQNYKKFNSRLQSSISGQQTREKHVIQQYFSRRH